MQRKHVNVTQETPQQSLLATSNSALSVKIQETLYSHEESLGAQLSEARKKNYFNPNFLIQKSITNSSIVPLNYLSLISSRVRRSNEISTLVEAVAKEDFTYWLSQEDIAHIARLEYNNYLGTAEAHTQFEIIGAISHLKSEIKKFLSSIKEPSAARLTLIINLSNLHWVTLVISHQNDKYVGYYVDSKDNPLPLEYYQLLLKHQIQPMSISPGFSQQSDAYNCGLWALENAAAINRMLNENLPLYQLVYELGRLRGKDYFDKRRILFATNLFHDPVWHQAYPMFHPELYSSEKLPVFLVDSHHSANIQKSPKRFKTDSNHEKVLFLLEVFSKTFIIEFTKRLAVYNLIAKGEMLSVEAFKTELKTGVTGALLGIGISQSMVGSIPSLVASLRILFNKYYLPNKVKAQQITKRLSELTTAGNLAPILSEAAVDIFYSFESQFMQVTDKAGDVIAMQKLAEDAVQRSLNYIGSKKSVENLNWDNHRVLKAIIELGVLYGPSEKFFDPSITKARVMISGNILQDSSGASVKTAKLYEKTGLVILRHTEQSNKFYYVKELKKNNQYGYRQPFDWEKEENGELRKSYKEIFTEETLFPEENLFLRHLKSYQYILKEEDKSVIAQRILTQIRSPYSTPIAKKENNKNSILFNLRSPIENFTGRIPVLKKLHEILTPEKTVAIIPDLSDLSIKDSLSHTASLPKSDSSQRLKKTSSHSQLAISGLGGIGKTQLALRYAELYMAHYDNNVLWINAETEENLIQSFFKLAKKLELPTKDHYNQEKDLEEITEEVYEYFSDRKSLFILDNVESYRAIEAYLPKSMLDNKPTVLITSRYSHWEKVAQVLPLNVFTEQEAEVFIKQELNIKDITQDRKIKELNKLLQGLPLALQQALAYIKLRKNIESTFSIDDYIELYKEKSEELLSFSFSHYNNDPYINTVFTVWLVTLDKIKAAPIGKQAIVILNIMAYLDPENITNRNFFYLRYIDPYWEAHNLSAIIHLLKSYSMINAENQEDKYSIHRLVQEVTRINLERNPDELKIIVGITQELFGHYNLYGSEDGTFHYLHFLLYMLEHNKDLKDVLFTDIQRTFFSNFTNLDPKYWSYFIELAYLKFPKEKFLKFLGKLLAFYTKSAVVLLVSEVLFYIKNQLKAEVFSKENVKYILEYMRGLQDSIYRIKKHSIIPEKRKNQIEAIQLIYNFKKEIFDETDEISQLGKYYACPSQSLKRSICSLPEINPEKIRALQYQAFKTHLHKIERISSYLNTGLFTKTILSDLFQGHWSEVAVNFGLIMGSLISNEAATELLKQGKILAAETPLLAEDFSLRKNVFSILLSEERFTNKRLFLGKTMQVISPFIRRGTSLFFVHQLKNQIQAYWNGDETVLPNMVANGVIVGVDGLEAGIESTEFLNLISGLSEWTNPGGSIIALSAWLSAEEYTSVQQVKMLEKYIHLSLKEEITEFFRAFFQMPPSEYLEIKVNNQQLLTQTISFLKKHPSFKRSIFPSFQSTSELSENSQVLLNETLSSLSDSDTLPDEPAEGRLFCLPGTSGMSTLKPVRYICKNAIGIQVTANRTGDTTLINLGEGNDKAIAFLNSPTLFLVQNGRKSYKGGDKENVFVLQGNSITGILKGGKGSNVLIANNFNPKNSDYLLRDSNGFLCGTNRNATLGKQMYCSSGNSLKLDNVNQIHGRKNQQDIIFINRGIRFIDGYGGESNEQLDCFFVTTPSYKNPMIVLRNNTRIVVYPNIGIHAVEYSIPTDEVGETQVQFDFKEAVQHRFFFEAPLQNLAAMTIENNTIHISLTDSAYKGTQVFSLKISNLYSAHSNTTDLTNISYFSQGIELKLLNLLNNNELYAQETLPNNKTMFEKVSLFEKLATQLDKSIVIQLNNNATISIGSGKSEILYTTGGLSESHLMMNGGENLCVILADKDTEFPLSNITLYDGTSKNKLLEQVNSLDARQPINLFKQRYPDTAIVSHVVSIENDLVLTINNIVNIRLKDALRNNWYQKLDIYMESDVPQNIAAMDDDIWTVVEAPLIFTDDKQIIILTKEDIGEEAEIILLRNMGDYLFFRHGTNLILNNCIGNSNDCCAIIAQKFYQIPEMKRKILSATFKFFDQDIQLQDHQKEIEHAADFSAYLAFVTANTTEIPSFLNSTESISHSSDQETSMPPLDRPKRQPDLEKTVSKLPEWLAIKTQSRLTTKTVHVPNSKTIRHTLDPEDSDKNLLKRHRDGFKPIMNEIKESMTSSTTRIGNWLNLLAEMSIGRFKKAVQSFFLGNKEFNPPAFPLDSKQANTHALPFCIPGAQQGQSFVNGITCYTTNRKVMIFLKDSNVKLKKPEDIYFKQSCRPVEFNERPSVYCEGEKTNMVYTPEIPQRPFEQINEQLTLLQVVLHEGKKLYGWLQHFFSGKNSEVNSPQRTSITREQKEIWKKLLTDIEVGFTDLENTCEEEVKLRWAWYILEDRKAEFDYLSRQSELDLEKINAFIENLQALQAELKVMMDRAPTTHEPDKSDLIRKMKESPSSISNYYHLDNTPVLSKKSVNIQNTELALQGNQNFFKTVRPSVPYSGLITVEKKYTPASA